MKTMSKATPASVLFKNGKKRNGYLFNKGPEDFKFLCSSKTENFLSTFDSSLIENIDLKTIESIDLIQK